jgi:hypothetical protein
VLDVAAPVLGLGSIGDSPEPIETQRHRKGGDDNAQGPAKGQSEAESKDDEILFGEGAIEALNPAVNGPAIQVLPLAICT